MATIKYYEYRKIAKDGDIILTHSKKPVASIIRWVDQAHWHHCELVHWSYGRLMGFGAHPEGAQPDFLSARFEEKNWDDFTVVRPNKSQLEVTIAITKLYEISEEFNKYDFGMIGNLLGKKFGLKINTGNKDLPICSELINSYLRFHGYNSDVVTPEDVLRQFHFEKII